MKKLIFIICTLLFINLYAVGIVTPAFIDIEGIKVNRQHFNVIDSTHTYSKNTSLIDMYNTNNWVLVTSKTQTNGVGSHDRKWESSEPGNIYANLNVPNSALDLTAHSGVSFEQIAAIAVSNIIKPYLENDNVMIKWPNDVIVNNKKICGVLSESNLDSRQTTIGIGVNVNLSSKKLNSIDQKATSLREETGNIFHEDTIDIMIKNIISQIVVMLRTGKTVDNIPIKDALLQYMELFIGKKAKVFDDETNCEYYGEIKGIDDNGDLMFFDEISKNFMIIKSGTLSIEEE